MCIGKQYTVKTENRHCIGQNVYNFKNAKKVQYNTLETQ